MLVNMGPMMLPLMMKLVVVVAVVG